MHMPDGREVPAGKSHVDPGGRPPDGVDDGGPFWMQPAVVGLNGDGTCPDCGGDLWEPWPDTANARRGRECLICMWLPIAHEVIPEHLYPCHPNCIIACGSDPPPEVSTYVPRTWSQRP
jgi:hypothetical protein